MLDHRARLAVMARTGILWQRIARRHARALEPIRPVVVPLRLERLLRRHPLVLEQTSPLLLLPGRGDDFDFVHATLFGAAMLLTARSDKPLYTPARRFTNAFVGWAGLVGLSVQYDHHVGFGRTSMSVDAFAAYAREAHDFHDIVETARERWQAPEIPSSASTVS